MTNPVRQPVYSGQNAVQTPFKGVTVLNVNKDTLKAVVRDAFGAVFEMRCDIMRAKGNLPESGESWLIDRQYGDWIFAAILNGGTRGVVVPMENVTGLAAALSAAGSTAATTGKVTAKGDLLVGTGPGVLARQGVGTGVLAADPSSTTGLSYSNALAQVLSGEIVIDQPSGGTAIRSTSKGAGIKLGSNIVQVVDGAGTSFNSIKATAFTVSSSATLKTDIEPFELEHGLSFADMLDATRPVRFRYRSQVEDPDVEARVHVGFLAEYIAVLHPDLLVGDLGGDPRELGIDSMGLIAFLWNAVRELSGRVRELERSGGRDR